MDSDGSNRTRLTDGQSEAFSPVWSPDGSKIAFVSDRDGSLDIWVMDSDGSNPVNLTQHEAKDRSPAWSPDGQWIAFASVRDSLYWELYVMRADGSDVQRLTWWEDASDLVAHLVARRDAPGLCLQAGWQLGDLYHGPRRLQPDAPDRRPADDTNPAWSPDGSRIAFESTRGEGYTDIYVMAVGGGEAVNLSPTRRGPPTWVPPGRPTAGASPSTPTATASGTSTSWPPTARTWSS